MNTVELEIYQMNNLTNGKLISTTVIDGLIFFKTTETRSFSVLNHLLTKNRITNGIMSISFEDFDTDPTKSISEKYTLDTDTVSISKDLSENLLPYFRKIEPYITPKKVIGIDISCMPIPIFARTLQYLSKYHSDKQIIIYYTEPAHYNLKNLFDFSTYGGEIEIKAIPGYEGKTAQMNETQRIVFYIMGFEVNLDKLIPQEINPNGIIPINGFPAYFPKYKDISLINNSSNNYHTNDIKIVFTEANNPFAVFNQLTLLMNKYKEYCIDVIPTGSKPMALGACLFALKNDNNIRLLFPFPSEYKNESSSGIGTMWEYLI